MVVSFLGEYRCAEHFEDVGDELRLRHLGQGLRGVESGSDTQIIIRAGACIGDAVSVVLPRFGLVGSEYGHTIEIVLDLGWEDQPGVDLLQQISCLDCRDDIGRIGVEVVGVFVDRRAFRLSCGRGVFDLCAVGLADDHRESDIGIISFAGVLHEC